MSCVAENLEQKLNELSSPDNIAATAKKFAELEKRYGPYSFGKIREIVHTRAG